MSTTSINPAAAVGSLAPKPPGQDAKSLEKPTSEAKETKSADGKMEASPELAPTKEAVQVTLQGAVKETKKTEATMDKKAQTSEVKNNMAERVQESIKESIKEAQGRTTSVGFQVFFEGGEVIVRVINRETGDVVREIPPDEVRNMQDKLQDLKGILVEDVT